MREDIAKRREKYNIQTQAMKVFGGRDMITTRPKGMSKKQFKYLQKLQNTALKMLFKGSPNRRTAVLMKPTILSEHHQLQVARAKAIKQGYLEEVRPDGSSISTNILTRLFNAFRKLSGGAFQTTVSSHA